MAPLDLKPPVMAPLDLKPPLMAPLTFNSGADNSAPDPSEILDADRLSNYK